MSRYEVRLTRQAAKQLASLERTMQLRIAGGIELLSLNPFPPKAQRLRGREAWRVRVGDYRLLYTVNQGELIIVVIRMAHRREVYRPH
jgi:mRNA interferase RelE/StbE